MMYATLVLAALAASAVASPEGRVRMEPSVTVFGGRNWEQVSRVTEADEIRLHFFLKHTDEELRAFDKALMARADPRSPLYGKWLSKEEVTARLAASPEAVAAVRGFLEGAGVAASGISQNREGDIMRVTVPATQAEQMLETELFHYTHRVARDVDIVRAGLPYSLPASVAEHVSFVGELLRVPRLRHAPRSEAEADATESAATTEAVIKRQLRRADSDSSGSNPFGSCGLPATYTTPAVLSEEYNMPIPVKSVAKGNSMAVAEFQLQYYDDADLKAFASACGTDTTTVANTYGGNIPSVCSRGVESCVEALLDIEYIGAMAGPIPLSVYYSSSYSLLDWIEGIGDAKDPELVHSVSYGNDEAQQTSDAYMESCNTEFMKVGAMGISILFASGDQGVWGREGVGSTFHPDFPAGSPYITAVGGTDLLSKSTIGEESVWVDGGGGFSDTFDAPDWQTDAVSAYLSSGVEMPDDKYYNDKGRGYPDVAALAGTQNAYYVAFGGGASSGGVGGTSAACPVFAAVVAQLNNIRLAAGKSALGFLNPFIYQNGDAFNDVVTGENNENIGTGFKAASGWDPATGWGTPDFAKLSALM